MFYTSKAVQHSLKEFNRDKVVIYLLENLVIKYFSRNEFIKSNELSNIYRITKLDDEGFYVETNETIKNYKKNLRGKPWDLVPFSNVKSAWKKFCNLRVATKDDFNTYSEFLFELFSKLPFVSTNFDNHHQVISFHQYKTDILPETNLDSTLGFLKEIAVENVNPKDLSYLQDANAKRIKAGERQGLRLLGFLDEKFNRNESLINDYIASNAKNAILRNQMMKNPYFKMTTQLLSKQIMLKKEEKRKALKELGMLIVQNSKGDNQMVESVSEKRTKHTISWMQLVGLLDEELNTKVEEHIRPLFREIMQNYVQARSNRFANHPLGKVVRQDIVESLYNLSFLDENSFTIKGSVGQGNWATVPWIAIMDNRITSSTQKGFYIVYLFSEDMQHVYLTLAQGVTETSKEEMRRINEEIQNYISMDDVEKGNNYHLGESKKAKDYVESTAAYIPYSLNNFPPEDQLIEDLRKMVGYYQDYIEYITDDPKKKKLPYSDQELIIHIDSYIASKGFSYEKEEIENLFLSLKTKPFVILSGISGTGKTKIVQWFAESLGATEENGQFTLIPVRPDWSDGSDLLGYVDIKGEFQQGPLTLVIQEASENRDKPYFVLLDEMNLARVEYYFSDILSVMESRRWENGELVTSSILPEDMIGEHLGIPENLFVVGTVNMDETTHPFSKKVLDRANTIEFNRVNLNNFAFLETIDEVEKLDIQNKAISGEFLQDRKSVV